MLAVECCGNCGGPLRGAFVGEPDDGRCAKCAAEYGAAQCASAQRAEIARLARVAVAATCGAITGTSDHPGAPGAVGRTVLVGQYRALQVPAEDHPDLRAGDKLRRAVYRGTLSF